MVVYICEKCRKEFSKKSNYDSHAKRKTPCVSALQIGFADTPLPLPSQIVIIKTHTKNVSPLRYPGGKTKACKQLDVIFNEHFDTTQYNTIVSPFFGGGSFEFYMQNKYNYRIVANDKFEALANFWNDCITHRDELCAKLYNANRKLIEKSVFSTYREMLQSSIALSPLTKSVMYFIVNRCSFSGSTCSGGFSAEASTKRFTKSSIDKIKQLDLSNFEIHNLDFEEFVKRGAEHSPLAVDEAQIQTTNSDLSVMFLDPPYYLEKKSRLYGTNGDLHENFDHERLYHLLSTIDKKWIMTYNNCEYIKRKYSRFKIIEASWNYGMNKSKKSSEIIIVNNGINYFKNNPLVQCESIKKLLPQQKGALCSVSGKKYEQLIYQLCKEQKLWNKVELFGGSSSLIDLICTTNNDKNIGIEIKKHNTPDWMQCSIVYNIEESRWKGTIRSKIPPLAKELIEHLIKDINIFNGEIPPFMKAPITHEEWLSVKKSTPQWNDVYITIPSNTIRKLYSFKNCQYIQISNGYGLYHLGFDVCNFGVPVFDIEQQFRIRTKIHTKKNKKGFCDLSVMVACQPKNIRSITPSPYSLDDTDKFPKPH